MAVNWWLNSHTSLFWINEKDITQTCLQHVKLQQIQWIDNDRVRVLLYGILPQEIEFFANFKWDDRLLIKYIETGQRDDPTNGKTIIALWGCRVIKKWIRNPVILDPSEEEAMRFYMRIECQAHIP